MKYVLIGVLGILGAATAFADGAPLKPFSYRVELAADGANCAHSDAFGARFSAATGAQVTSVTCTAAAPLVDNGHNYDRAVVIVNYLATSEPATYHALYTGRDFQGTPEDGSGLFATYADCMNALPNQTTAFETQTTLLAVAAHCDSSSDVTKPGFALTIEGFGTPKARLYVLSDATDISGYTDPDVLRAYSTIAQIDGAQITYQSDSSVFYYAQYPLSILTYDLGMMNTNAECEAQIADAAAIYSLAGSDHHGQAQAFCVGGSDPKQQKLTLTVVSDSGLMLQTDWGYGSARYASFDECRGDRARVIQNGISNGAKILGAICSPGDVSGEYKMSVYSNTYGNATCMQDTFGNQGCN